MHCPVRYGQREANMVAQTDDIDPRGVLGTKISSGKSGGRDEFLATTALG